MLRIVVLTLTLMPLLLATQSGRSASRPVLSISFYAPAQTDTPVHIVDFENSSSEIEFELSNTSDKPVVAVAIGVVYIAPLGCDDIESPWRVRSTSGGAFTVNIDPHGRGFAGRAGTLMFGTPRPSPMYPHFPRMAVESARNAGTAYMQVQFGITTVSFADGTAWPAEVAPLFHKNFNPYKDPTPVEAAQSHKLNHSDPFDPSLVEAEAGKCPQADNVINAAKLVKEVSFERETSTVQTTTNNEHTPPHLRFSCTLEGLKAVCRLPISRDGGHLEAQPEIVQPR